MTSNQLNATSGIQNKLKLLLTIKNTIINNCIHLLITIKNVFRLQLLTNSNIF